MNPLREDMWLTAVDKDTGEVLERADIAHLNDAGIEAEAQRLTDLHPGCQIVEDAARA
ncbi:hypothetical protein [Pseudoclavibacter sp. CFCC 14310]|uniref:hypothetical protein n=1 Tax=Pseudoclavibacter sp. CFCC 14310 TaxID=2615180 RepID=UPI001787BD56|nr:hypothetical protein [Pseudoclavibacter sp. CFCC 14310]